MTTSHASRWQLRPFISQTLFIGFLILVLTGLVLFIAPSNRIVRSVNWNFLWLSKDQWQSLHNWLSALFIVASLVHTLLNWQALKNYCFNQYQMTRSHWRELLAALAMILVLCLMAIWYWGPAGWLMETRDSFRHQIPVQESLEPMESVRPDSMVSDSGPTIAPAIRNYSVHASEKKNQLAGTGKGWGEMTLRQFCDAESISLETAMTQLNQRGIRARETQTLRELADQIGIRPGQLARDLSGGAMGSGKNRRRTDF